MKDEKYTHTHTVKLYGKVESNNMLEMAKDETGVGGVCV